MKNLIDVQAKLFINYVETLNSIQNLYVSSDKLSEYKRALKKYSDATTDLCMPEMNDTVSETIEKQIDFLKNVTDYNLMLYKNIYTFPFKNK